MKGTIFYIGLGKTGSMTLCNSIINRNIFHSHNTECYDYYCNNILSSNNLTCYDLVKIFGRNFNYKPIIVETIREPISLLISLIGEFSKVGFQTSHPYNLAIPKNIIDKYYNANDDMGRVLVIIKMFNLILEEYPHFIFRLFNKKYFRKTEKFDISRNFNNQNQYLFKEFDQYSLLILKFENIKNWGNIFSQLGIEYVEKSDNLTSDYDFYPIRQILYKNLKLLGLTTNKLKNIYSQYNNYLSNYYLDSEINEFIKKFSCDQSDIDNLENRLNQAQSVIDNLENRINQAQSVIDNLENQLNQKQLEVDNLNIRLNQVQSVDNLNIRLNQAQSIIDNLENQLNQKQSVIDNLNIRLNQVQSVDNLENQLNQAQLEIDNFNYYEYIHNYKYLVNTNKLDDYIHYINHGINEGLILQTHNFHII